MDCYDLGIIGAGVSGAFAALKVAKEYKNIKTIIFDIGRPPQKRRRQLEGFLGCLPNSDGKLYINDLNNISEISGNRKTKSIDNWISNYISNIIDFKIIKDKQPNASAEKRIKKAGFDIKLNDYIQLYPKDIHILSKDIASHIISSKHIKTSFDDDVLSIQKQKNSFLIISANKQVECKRLLICTGRAGWRWTKELYSSFGIVDNNDIAKFGVRVEVNSFFMKDFNKSNCSIFKNDLEIGPLSWNGTVIPEDHINFAISAFRSNENRWKSDKVSFNLIGNRNFENKGFEQIDRLGQLTFILSNDRILKEKISTVMSKKSKISIIPEYDWLINAFNEVELFLPNIINKGYFHIPTILPLAPKIKLGNNFATDVDGMFCAGEAAGIPGILSAMVSGIIGLDGAVK